jgi:hypothetical protein
MNAAIAKLENTSAGESDKTPSDRSPNDSTRSPESIDEALLNEDADRRLYRRSVAYFFFGFGYNKHEILTDEP